MEIKLNPILFQKRCEPYGDWKSCGIRKVVGLSQRIEGAALKSVSFLQL